MLVYLFIVYICCIYSLHISYILIRLFLCLCCSRDTMLKLWDCDSGKEIRSMGGHTGGITSVLLIRKDDHGRSGGKNIISTRI